jgi:hypothetical protein
MNNLKTQSIIFFKIEFLSEHKTYYKQILIYKMN